MALTITHTTVASDPQSPLLDHTDWNANHSIAGSIAWGEITGTLASQSDLQTALNAKAPLSSPTFTGTVGGITAEMVGALGWGKTIAMGSIIG